MTSVTLFVSREDKFYLDLICANNHSICNPHNGICIRNLSKHGRQPFYDMSVLSFLLVALNKLHTILVFAQRHLKAKSTVFEMERQCLKINFTL